MSARPQGRRADGIHEEHEDTKTTKKTRKTVAWFLPFGNLWLTPSAEGATKVAEVL